MDKHIIARERIGINRDLILYQQDNHFRVVVLFISGIHAGGEYGSLKPYHHIAIAQREFTKSLRIYQDQNMPTKKVG